MTLSSLKECLSPVEKHLLECMNARQDLADMQADYQLTAYGDDWWFDHPEVPLKLAQSK